MTARDETAEEMYARGDAIGALCKLVKDAGLTMTLYGQPVSGPGELREKALDSAIDRITDAALEGRQRRAVAIEHVALDRAAGAPWNCECPWCAVARREAARRAVERLDLEAGSAS